MMKHLWAGLFIPVILASQFFASGPSAEMERPLVRLPWRKTDQPSPDASITLLEGSLPVETRP